MYKLKTLGSLDLHTDAGKRVSGLLAQPKRAALLIYLLAARHEGRVRRNELLALFWPEQDEASARHALSQSIYKLREALGRDVLSADSEDVTVAPRAVSYDVANFLGHVERREWLAALDVYGGDFLNGFHIDEVAFENWAHQERQRLREIAAHAAWSLACEQLDRNALVDAQHTARRAFTLAPTGEHEVRQFVRRLATAAGPRRALSFCDDYKDHLAAEYELAPEPATLELHAEIASGLALSKNDETSGGSVHEDFVSVAADSPRKPLRAAPVGIAAGIVIVLLSILAAAWIADRPATAGADSDALFVMPFRSIGHDSALKALGEGVVDIIGGSLPDMTPRPIDPHTTFAALRRANWTPDRELPRETALAVARDLRAGMALFGSIVTTAEQVTILAEFFDVKRGRTKRQFTITGSGDSLDILLNKFVAKVGGIGLEESEDRLQAYDRASLPVVRAHLAGLALYRRGKHREALTSFEEAIRLDSTFAPAFVYYLYAAANAFQEDHPDRIHVARLACASRFRVSERERLRLIAVGRCADVAPDVVAYVGFLEEAVRTAPDDPELWMKLADRLLHEGAALPAWRKRSIYGFERALALGWADAEGVHAHLLQMHAEIGDTVAFRRAFERMRSDTTSLLMRRDTATGQMVLDFGPVDWLRATLRNDTATLNHVRRLRFQGVRNLWWIIMYSQALGLNVGDAELAVQEMERRVIEDGLSIDGMELDARAMISLNGGRPKRALAAYDAQNPRERRGELPFRPLEALFWDGARSGAEDAIAEMEALLQRRGADSVGTTFRARAHCSLALWALGNSDPGAAERNLAQHLRYTREIPKDDAMADFLDARSGLCAQAIRAQLAFQVKSSDRLRQLERLDSILIAHAVPAQNLFRLLNPVGQLIAARLFEQSGNLPQALAAVRRTSVGSYPLAVSSLMREQGRLALMMGDTAAAIRSYRHFLALRYDPEPTFRLEANRIVALVAELERRRQ